ncbi:MAG: hypothetical protein RMN51_06135 [Verrucomicrobiota bacterium]|nr:hypothetical protein [Limisphaera sp.]MDW8381669.1 hypothetical protein [Verrucomicrobiota bacterium]
MNDTSSSVNSYRAAVCQGRSVLLIIAAVTLCMVGVAHAPLPDAGLRTALVLVAAGVNAILVAGRLMHVLQERHVIFVLLAFTVLFFVALMGLCLWAHGDTPKP